MGAGWAFHSLMHCLSAHTPALCRHCPLGPFARPHHDITAVGLSAPALCRHCRLVSELSRWGVEEYKHLPWTMETCLLGLPI